MVDMSYPITQAQFGGLVGISQQAVSDLVKREILREGGTAGEWLRCYTAHLREVAAGRADSGDLVLASERARLAKEQADRVAMLNAEKRGELAPAYLLEEVLAKAGAKVSGILAAIPGAIKRREPGLSAASVRLIQDEVAKACNIAAAVTLDDLDVDIPPDDGDVDGDGPD